MDRILDLDLDFFVWPIANLRGPDAGRLPEEQVDHVASEIEVRQYLETRCGLSRGGTVPGAQLVEHVEAFWTWDRWLREAKLSTSFEVVHIDAHADLGLGDSSWYYLMTELLALPLDKRNHPRTGHDALNSGSYLAYAIANRWIASVKYIYPTGPMSAAQSSALKCPDDIMKMFFRDENPETGMIELRRVSSSDAEWICCGAKEVRPIHTEPAVPFECIAGSDFNLRGSHTSLLHSRCSILRGLPIRFWLYVANI